MKKLLVVHVDDEVLLMEHFPDQLRVQFNLLFPDLAIGQLTETTATNSDIEASSSFTVTWPDGDCYEVIYRIFAELSIDNWEGTNLAIFDYLTVNKRQELEPVTMGEIKKAVGIVGRDNVYVFTGYPETAKELARLVSDEHFIVKPGDSVWMTEQFARRLFDAMQKVRLKSAT